MAHGCLGRRPTRRTRFTTKQKPVNTGQSGTIRGPRDLARENHKALAPIPSPVRDGGVAPAGDGLSNPLFGRPQRAHSPQAGRNVGGTPAGYGLTPLSSNRVHSGQATGDRSDIFYQGCEKTMQGRPPPHATVRLKKPDRRRVWLCMANPPPPLTRTSGPCGASRPGAALVLLSVPRGPGACPRGDPVGPRAPRHFARGATNRPRK